MKGYQVLGIVVILLFVLAFAFYLRADSMHCEEYQDKGLVIKCLDDRDYYLKMAEYSSIAAVVLLVLAALWALPEVARNTVREFKRGLRGE